MNFFDIYISLNKAIGDVITVKMTSSYVIVFEFPDRNDNIYIYLSKNNEILVDCYIFFARKIEEISIEEWNNLIGRYNSPEERRGEFRIIRWMGAFNGKNYTLEESLKYEMSSNVPHVCAEPIFGNTSFLKVKTYFGIEYSKDTEIIKAFNRDAYTRFYNGMLESWEYYDAYEVKYNDPNSYRTFCHGELVIGKRKPIAFVYRGRMLPIYKELAKKYNLPLKKIEIVSYNDDEYYASTKLFNVGEIVSNIMEESLEYLYYPEIEKLKKWG